MSYSPPRDVATKSSDNSFAHNSLTSTGNLVLQGQKMVSVKNQIVTGWAWWAMQSLTTSQPWYCGPVKLYFKNWWQAVSDARCIIC